MNVPGVRGDHELLRLLEGDQGGQLGWWACCRCGWLGWDRLFRDALTAHSAHVQDQAR